MFRPVVFVMLFCAAALSLRAADEKSALIAKGKLLYLQHCVICHQGAGQGTPGTFPPLVKSDYLMAKPENGIRAVVEGLSGRITVNGSNYNNTMPPILLTDDQVAAVLTFVRGTWNSAEDFITPAQVATVRAKSRFKTYDALKAAADYAPLPKPPEGFTIREVTRFTENPIKLALKPGARELYVVSGPGHIWRVETTGRTTLAARGEDYLEPQRGGADVQGFAFDKTGRLFVSSNRRLEKTQPFVTNEVTIYRSVSAAKPFVLEPYFRAYYPWGIGGFNHGANQIAQGPDGFIYMTSGARTDGNEPGSNARYYSGGEVELTACVWRFPADGATAPEIFARGLRNAFGFCWNERGEMFATDNGPDADMPEELNLLERGKHYGFPHQFSSSTNKPYAYTPETLPGQTFVRPVVNLGPAGSPDGKSISTFHPHSSPAGLMYCGENAPASLRGSFLVTRYGNLLKRDPDVGFDLLQMRVTKTATGYESQTTTWLAPLARPIDVVQHRGSIYVLEYTRPLNHKGDVPMLPGRLLELRAK
jgi:mono/diheme cytochrome c family protein